MRRSKTLQKIRNKQVVRMCALGHYFPGYIKYVAHFNFDCIWLDLEHRTMDSREIQSLLAFSHLYDVDVMVRPPTLEKSRLYRYLEDGATGLMIPHVSTVEKGEQLVQSVKFPPLGDRGIDAAGLDADFGLPDPLTYTAEANRETFLIVQIETPEAVNNVEEISHIEGIDGLFLGPGDLNLRLQTNANNTLTLDESRQRVADACRQQGKAWGQPAGSPEILKSLVDQGAQLLPHGSDFMAVMKNLDICSQDFDALLKDEKR